MEKVLNILKKLPYKYLGTITFFILLLLILFANSAVPIFSIGFLLDVLFIIGFISLIHFSIGNNLAKNIIFTVVGAILTILFIVDHIYYSNFKKFSSITSLNNAGMVMDNMDAYGVKLDGVSVLLLLTLAGLITFLFVFKNKNNSFRNRVFYIIPSLFIFFPFLVTYIMAYNDVTKLGIIIYRTSYAFPEFVKNFGYLIYRYEDIAVVIDNAGGNL